MLEESVSRQNLMNIPVTTKSHLLVSKVNVIGLFIRMAKVVAIHDNLSNTMKAYINE